MTELMKEENGARPCLGRAFLSGCRNIKFPPPAAQFIFWTLVVAGTALDLWSKWAAFESLGRRPSGEIPIIDGFFRLVAVENTGAAFGIASGQRWLLTVVSVVALVVILAIFFFSAHKSKVMHIALGLFTAGVCGNLYDRIFNEGRVRDFIDIVYWPGKHWPAFNAADSMLCIGVGLLIIWGFLTDRLGPEHGRQHK